MQVKRYVAAATTMFALTFAGSANAAPTECTVGNFTTDGVFDQEGYLACLSVLPPTGSSSLDTFGVAAGVIAVGGAMLLAGRRRRSASISA